MRPRTLIRGNGRVATASGAPGRASMRPRTLIRGNLPGAAQRSSLPVSFNEAADSHPRKQERPIVRPVARYHASMRPRTLIRGNLATRRTRQVPRGRFNEAADSHPRKRLTPALVVVRIVASMRPRTLIRGNGEITVRRSSDGELQ